MVAICNNDITFDSIAILIAALLASAGAAYWAYNMKIVIYAEYFLQYSFLPAKKIFFKDVIEVNVRYGHNGPFSPINMTQIISSTGVKAELNNFIYKKEDRDFLINFINQKNIT